MTKIIVKEKITKLVRTKPVIIITTLHKNGIVNAGTFGAYTNLDRDVIGVALWKTGHTIKNIRRNGEFVINVPTIKMAQALQICARDIKPSESELDHAGLSTDPAVKVSVPIIRECIANIECKMIEEIKIGGHNLILAKTIIGHIEEKYIDKDGGLDVIKAKLPYAIRYPDPVYATLGKTVTVEE